MSIGRKQRFDGGVGLVDILRVSGQRDPAERSDTPAEERTDIGGDEAGEGKRVLNTFFLGRSEEHTSELQSLMRISYAVFCLKKKNNKPTYNNTHQHQQTPAHFTAQQHDNHTENREEP